MMQFRPVLSVDLAVVVMTLIGAISCSKQMKREEPNAPNVGRIRLRTSPSGAEVWIDGEKKVEATPATLLLSPGRHHLTIQARGAKPLERDIDVAPGEFDELDLKIPAPPDATVTVLSDVVGAKVVINGYTRGETPLIAAITRPGPLDVTVDARLAGVKSKRATLEIGEKKTMELFFGDVECAMPPPPAPLLRMSLPPRSGMLTLGLDPPGDVYDEHDVLLGHAPLEQKRFAIGEHRLFLKSRDGRHRRWLTVEIEDEKLAIVRIRFREEDEDPAWRPDAGPVPSSKR